MSSDSNFNDSMFDDGAKATAAAQAFGEKLSFGKFTFVAAQYSRWNEDAHAFEPTTQADYNANPKGATLKYVINVDVQELNPELSFTYDRSLDVGRVDWNKTFVPSLGEVFGKDAVYDAKGKVDPQKLSQVLRKLHNAYVCVSDVPQQPRKDNKHINPNSGEPYRTTKLVAVYPDKASCQAAQQERFGKKDNGAVPNANEVWDAVKDDADFIGAVKTAAATSKIKPKQEAAVKAAVLEWELTEGDWAAHHDEIMALVG